MRVLFPWPPTAVGPQPPGLPRPANGSRGGGWRRCGARVRGVGLLTTLLMVMLAVFPARLQAATVTWVGERTGAALWNTPANWSTGRVPGVTDDVVLTEPTTNLVVTVTGVFTVKSITSSCTLLLTSDLGVNTVLNVSDGLTNRGAVLMGSQRPDRSTSLNVTGTGGFQNEGLLRVVAEGGGGRRLGAGLSNRGRVIVDEAITFAVSNAGRVFTAAGGEIRSLGTLDIEGGRVNLIGGGINGLVRAFNATVASAPSMVAPATLRVLGTVSVLSSNASPAMTLRLDTDVGNPTTLTASAGAVNAGRILMGSSRSDRAVRIEIPSGMTNLPGGVIEAVAEAGGDRTLNGRLVNQGRLVAGDAVLLATGTYQADGGVVEGDVRFLNARVVPTKATATATSLQLFGTGTILQGDNPLNMTLRVISDVGANATLTLPSNMVNRGSITLESLRADRTTSLLASGLVVENRGTIQAVATGGGGRVIKAGLVNHGTLLVDPAIQLDLDNTGASFQGLGGQVDVKGALAVNAGRVHLAGGSVAGDVKLFSSTLSVASTVSTAMTLQMLGRNSVLSSNASPTATILLTTDVGNETLLTTGPGAFNAGKILMGSARSDRSSRLEFGAGFTNRAGAIIEAVSQAGGERSLNGRLVNLGQVLASDIRIELTGTYQSDGGRVDGDVRLMNSRVILTRATTEPTSLQLFGASTVLQGDNPQNMTLRVISDVGANAALTCPSNMVNRGTIRLESLRSDRTTSLLASGFLIENRGVLQTEVGAGGSRTLRASLDNRGTLTAGPDAGLLIENAGAVFTATSGTIDATGGVVINSGRVNLRGGLVQGDLLALNGTIGVAPGMSSPTTLRVMGPGSVLDSNASPVVTLKLDTDAGNLTTLTTSPGAANDGRIILGSSRSDRTSRLEVGAGFTNSGTGLIQAVNEQGGGRQINGRLVNQGLLVAVDVPLEFRGTYESDGGRVEGEVQFLNARVIPLRPSAQPTELKLFGAGSVLARDNLSNLVLRVLSDVGANAVLTLTSNSVNQGTIILESLRSDRTTALASSDGTVVNGERGLIMVRREGDGGRAINGPFRNRGSVALGYPLTVAANGADHVNSGAIDLGGQSLIVRGRSFLNGSGARLFGSGSLDVAAVAFTNAGILSPGSSPGRIAITGNYSQRETAVLEAEVAGNGGPGVALGHDILEITGGTATLSGGTLSTRVLGSFVPEAQARFRVMSASGGVTGQFGSGQGLQVLANRYFQVEYTPNAVDLATFSGVNSGLAPSITLHPASQQADEQGSATFRVEANGTGPFRYQWRFNGNAIPGATNSTFTLARIALADFGDYDVVVSNAAGNSTSQRASLAKKSGEFLEYDYGDAPEAPFPTTVNNNGAAQKVYPGFSLGASIDADDGSLQNATATADGGDEDGVLFLDPLIPGAQVTIRVLFRESPDSLTGRLSAWIDWGQDDSWANAGDYIIQDRRLLQRTNDFVITVPPTAVVGTTFARFRLYTDTAMGFAGKSTEPGEVEDYQVTVGDDGEPGGGTGGNSQATRDFGDAPDSYKTLEASDGPRHLFDPQLFLGSRVDLETNGAPSLLAVGDDLASQPDDEDGVTGSPFLQPGGSVVLNVTVVGGGLLDAWVDFNRTNSFGDPGEKVLSGVPVTNQVYSFTLTVPATAVPGGSFARFRLSRQGTTTWFGPAPNGEVEDYAVVILAPKRDWGDAPEDGTTYPTTQNRTGAWHDIADGFRLGKSEDSEGNGQPNGNATGDDAVPAGAADDEDGVTFNSPLNPGLEAEIEVEASAPGKLDAWIDFGDDGSWAEATDRIFTARDLVGGVNVLRFTVPATAKRGPTFARFRLSRSGLNTFSGPGGEGEVEDYRVVIEQTSECELSCNGRDFWFTFPGNYAPDPANPVVPRLRISGAAGTSVTVSIPGLGLTIATNVAGNGTVTVTLPSTADLGNLNDGILARGVHVTATSPVGIHAISQVQYTSDGFLALPTEVLTGEYVVAAYPNVHVGVPELSGTQFALVATQPNTTVLITPSVETGLRIGGVPYSVTLTNAGDCYQLRNTNDAPADLTGTLIEADKPVAVLGGHMTANVNSRDLFFSDYLVEQIPPIERLGSEYFTAPLATRLGGELVRVVAARRNTELTIDGDSITLTNRGEVYEYLATQASHIKANKPVYVAQFASSSDFDGVANADPFMVTVPGRALFTSSHTFATGGTNFSSHHVTVIAPDSVTSLTLDGSVRTPTFTPIPGSNFRYAHLDVAQGNHTLAASAEIGVIAYGWNLYESYGWPSCLFFGDTTPPRLTCLTNKVTVQLGQFGNDVPCKSRVPDLRPLVTFQDNCGVGHDAPITQEPAPGSLIGVGTHEVVLSVTDNRGNTGTCVITLEVVDPNPSNQITLTCPDDITVRCAGTNGTVVQYEVEALRGCTPVAVTCDPPSGSLFPQGTTVVTCTVNEPGQPIQRCTFTVTVDCQKKRQVRINPPSVPVPTPEAPNPPAEIVVEWDEETGVFLEVADQVDGPWIRVDATRGRHVIKIARERGKFYRLRGGN